jgi:lycopene cyclase domain-containing protein
METYLLVNIVVVSIVILVLRITTISRAQLITLGVLLVLTTVFDSMIVGFGIVAYDADKILGIYIGNAPIEDFFYAILAVFIVPTVWHILERQHVPKS